jgi:large subunit ribosomal protein L15
MNKKNEEISLNSLPKIKNKSKKRLGRGYGSGKGGHTVGRGAKGAKARSKVGLLFEGTKIRKSFLRRIPFLRGKSKFKPLKLRPVPINIEGLNVFSKNSKVNIESLVGKGLVGKKEASRRGVKILAKGELKIPLTIELSCSQKAEQKIKKAGGKVVLAK